MILSGKVGSICAAENGSLFHPLGLKIAPYFFEKWFRYLVPFSFWPSVEGLVAKNGLICTKVYWSVSQTENLVWIWIWFEYEVGCKFGSSVVLLLGGHQNFSRTSVPPKNLSTHWDLRVFKETKTCKMSHTLRMHELTVQILCYLYMWCDQAKLVWSQSNLVFIFLINCMYHFHSYLLQKPPVKLVNWFQRYEQLKDAQNRRKQNTFSTLFGAILKSIFPTSDWFCLITSYMILLRASHQSRLI